MQGKIIIYTPEYREWTGGIIALHKLGSILKSLGEEVAFSPHKNSPNPFWSPYDIPVAYKASPRDIVVYPEGVRGDPLGAKRRVTYYLGAVKNLRPGFQLFYSEWWARKMNVKTENVLHISDSKLDVFYDRKGERKGDCFTTRKNKHPNFIHLPGAYEIPRGMRQEKVAEVFNSHERFICYDFSSFLCIQAAMCGCESIVAKCERSRSDLDATFPYGAVGVKYGEDGDRRKGDVREIFRRCEEEQVGEVERIFKKIREEV